MSATPSTILSRPNSPLSWATTEAWSTAEEKDPRNAQVSKSPTPGLNTLNPTDFSKAVEESVSRGDDISLDKALQRLAADGPEKLRTALEKRYSGDTLLMMAARGGHWQVGSTLLRYGINPSVGRAWSREDAEYSDAATRIRNDKSLTTPLYLAARRGHHQFVDLLLGAGVPNDDVMAAFLSDVDLKVAITTARRSKISAPAVRGVLDAWVAEAGGHVCAERLLFAMRDYKSEILSPKTMLLAAKHLRAPAIKLLYTYGLRADQAVRADENADLAEGRVRTSSFWAYPLDVAVGRVSTLKQHDIPALQATVAELVLSRGVLKADHLNQLVSLNDLQTLSLGIKLVDDIGPKALATAVANGFLAQVALLLERRRPRLEQLDVLLTQAQDAGFAQIYNLLSAAKSCSMLEGKGASSSSFHNKLSALWSSSSRIAQNSEYLAVEKETTSHLHKDTELELAKERYALLHRQALATIKKEAQDISLPPPRAANTERQLTVFRAQR